MAELSVDRRASARRGKRSDPLSLYNLEMFFWGTLCSQSLYVVTTAHHWWVIRWTHVRCISCRQLLLILELQAQRLWWMDCDSAGGLNQRLDSVSLTQPWRTRLLFFVGVYPVWVSTREVYSHRCPIQHQLGSNTKSDDCTDSSASTRNL